MSTGRGDIAVADELAIRRTLAAYCQHLDDGDFSAVAHQFTPDGSITFGDRGGATGRAEIEAWYAERNPPERRGRHLTLNTIVDLEGDHATAWSDFAFLGFVVGELRPLFAGRYHDEFVRAEGGWLIARRVAAFLAPA
jgi:3-phenylpropionate/cinnamic acid dioxygenase small subunit